MARFLNRSGAMRAHFLEGAARPALLVGSALALVLAAPAIAQTASPASSAPQDDSVVSTEAGQTQGDDAGGEAIVVRGIRGSLASAVRVKRDAPQIVDTISAEDIGKLPDQNIADSLQRVTGVQISRSNGQGDGVAIRGLTQIRYELDGATLTGNGTGRAVSFQSIPSELFARLEVYKSPTADMAEGGLGGTINLVTRKPFDLNGLTVSGSMQQGYSDFRKGWFPKASGLIADNWQTGIGRIGVLLNVSYDKLSLRSDNFNVLSWDRVGLGDLDGDGVVKTAPDGPLTSDEVWRPRQLRLVNETQDRERVGAVGTLQWAPADNLEFTVVGSYNRFKYNNDYRLLRLDVDKGLAATTSYTRADDGTLTAATVTNAAVLTNNFVTPESQTNYTGQFNVDWHVTDRLRFTAKADIARGRDDVPIVIYPTLNSLNPIPLSYDFDAGTPIPSITTSFDFNNLANYKLNTVVPETRDTHNDEDAFRADLSYDLGEGLFRKIAIGVRHERRTLSQANDHVTSTAFTGTPVLDQTFLPSYAYTGTLATGNDFLNGVAGDMPRGWAGYNSSYLNGEGGLNLLHLVGLDPPFEPNLTAYYTVKERTWAGYARLDMGGQIGAMPWSANAGVRVVKTNSDSFAYLPDNTGTLVWTNVPNDYTDVLPSANFKLNFTDKLLLRLAAAKVIARPGADRLSAATSINYGFQTATGGNPTLSPFRANQFDASLEWYFRPGDLLSVAVFYKDVAAFISNEIVDVTIHNVEFPGKDDFRLSRPVNGKSGKIKGFEVGFQHNFVELPGALSGFGVQANYTFIDSTTPNTDPFTGDALPLEGLSKNSYNGVLFYEKYGFSARLAYNWREKYLTGTVAGSPVFSGSVGQLDASASWDVNDRFTITFDVTNLNDVKGYTYQTSDLRLLSYTENGRQFMGGVRFHF